MIINIHDNEWFERQKIAGKCVAKILQSSADLLKTPNVSLKDLENNADFIFNKDGCTSTFFNYKGFPSKICTSVNDQLVHGIVTDYVLREGDLVSVDLGATYEGAIADAAYTFVYGETAQSIMDMLKTCQRALYAGIDAIKCGGRIGDIGFAISKTVNNSPFGLITEYGGHGLDYDIPHAPPFVANKGRPNEGLPIINGLAIAIEPMVTLSKNTKTKLLADNWTVMADTLCCHFEHSLYINDNTYIVTEHGMSYG